VQLKSCKFTTAKFEYRSKILAAQALIIIMKHRLRGKAYLGIVPPYPQKQTFAGMNREVMKSHWRNNRGSLLGPA